jgi:general nucleoside transport system permease protein
VKGERSIPRIDEALLNEELEASRSVSASIAVYWSDLRQRALWPVLAFLITIVLALIAAIPVILVSGSSPLSAYHALYTGSLGGKQAISETLIEATPLLFAGLAVATAFQASLFNIGVEGQLVVGGLAAGTIGAKIHLPTGIHLLVAILGGMAAGALWALLPGLLKAYRGVHEVITTIMLNYVAFGLSRYLVSPGGLLVSNTQPSATDRVLPSARLTQIWHPTRLHTGIFIALGAVVFIWYFLYRTPLGYRFRLVGANPLAAKFNGISPVRVTVQAMLLSGALAGLAGTVEVLGLYGRYFDSFSPGYGFDAIAVALLGLLNPFGVMISALFFGGLRAGSVLLQARTSVSREMISVISGLVVGFVAAQVAIERLIRRRWKRPSALADVQELPILVGSLAEPVE